MQSLFKILFALVIAALIGVSCTKEKEEIEEVKERTFEMEMQELDELLKEKEANGFDVDTTKLGIFYIIYNEGTGPYPEAGDTCVMEYLAFHTKTGKEFDATRDYAKGAWEFIYLYQNLPTGLNDGIALMNKGTRMEIIIPSPMAFGSQGTSKVPPYTTVAYVATMHDIRFKD